MFIPDIKQHLHLLGLDLSGNALQCDIDLCWLKEAKTFRSLKLHHAKCINKNNVDLQNVDLNCTSRKFYI